MIKKYKEKLDKKLKDSKEQLKTIEENDPYKRPDYSDENTQDDDSSEREEHDRSAVLQEDLKVKIQRMKKALNKLFEGNYGQCETCGQDIDKARLNIMPEAEICMKCARKK